MPAEQSDTESSTRPTDTPATRPSPRVESRRRETRGLRAATLLGVLAVSLGPLFSPVVHAQGDAGELPPPPLQLDATAMLDVEAILPSRVTGPVWHFEAGEGRRLVVLPVILPVGDSVVMYDNGALRLRRGRLLAWRVPEPPHEDDATSVGGVDRNRDERPRVAPQIARELEVHPDGTLHWKLDRVLPGAEVQRSDNLYCLLLDREHLLALAPPQLDRPTRDTGESAADFQQRRMQAMETARQAAADYRDLKSEIRDLPDTFSQAIPPYVEAIFELHGTVDTLELSGAEPLPWEIGLEDLRAVAAAGGGGGRGAASGAQTAAIMLDALDRWPATYTERLVAAGFAHSLVQSEAPLGDGLADLADALIHSEDAAARRMALGAVVDAGLSPQAQRVLDAAASDDDAVVGLHVLRGLMLARAGDREELARLLPRVNHLLADGHGPGADVVVRVLARVVDGLEPDSDGVTSILDVFGPGVPLGDAPVAQHQAMVQAVVESAVTNVLAAYWLDHALLGSDDPPLFQAALGEIARRPLPAAQTRQAFAARNAPSDRLALDSLEHHLLTHLASDDETTRSLAWRAALRFTIGPFSSRGSATDIRWIPLYLAVARSAGAASSTSSEAPSEAPSFFESQAQDVGRMAGLMLLIGHGDAGAARTTAPMLMRAAQANASTVAEALKHLTAAERDAFAARLYQAQTGGTTAVAALLRLEADPEGKSLHDWYADRLADGAVPPDSAWVAAAGGDSDLLGRVAGQDAAVLRAAAAALVAAAGGDTTAAAALAQDFLSLSEPDKFALRKAWARQSSIAMMRDFKDVAGQYRLVIRMAGGNAVPEPAQSAAALVGALQGNVMDLGEFRIQVGDEGLRVQGVDLTLGVRIADGNRSLVIEQPAQLEVFDDPGLEDFFLDRQDPMVLTEVREGFWWAQVVSVTQQGQIMLVRAGD